MAKNIIKLKDKRPDLVVDFTKWLESRKTCYYGDYYDDYDEYAALMQYCGSLFPNDDYDYNDWDSRWDAYEDEYEKDYWNKHAHKNDKKSSKRGKRGEKKKTKSNGESPLSEDEIDALLVEQKSIYFYDDIKDKTTVHKFSTLKRFLNFLDDNGIDITDNELSKFIRAEIRHCCINPLTESKSGFKEIISDHSFGALAYEVADDAITFND